MQGSGKVNTAALDSKPDYPFGNELYIEAFNLLNRSRAQGMSTGCIPLTEIEAYIRLYLIEDVEMFVTLMTAMDNVYLEKSRSHG
jgi:hypothetical protein